jgi:hypothetical protein
MKGNIKKLSVCMIIVAIAMFMVVGTASAVFHHSLQGEYAVTGTIRHILTPFGFNTDNRTPNDPASAVTSNSITCLGIVTFKRDGTGTFDTTGVLLVVPPQLPPQIPHADAFHWSFTFTYDVAGDGALTIDADENSFKVTFDSGASFTADKYSLSGVVSPDNKTIMLGPLTTFVQTLTFQIPPGMVLYGITNGSYVLTRMR